ncbi:hypothetical protein N7462_000650 [Penicillium macrosclerotiorum]|uniref:uncharacterized protein n=1 Tax=Penicillium macrosclerotiorum TaxID=303699 RepID=UPI002547DF02|nr:uncharacterized protein N7462_000650 [Penicillium macrosclerotiorum]KAJ5698645.1 hypothetical protein N7462_000650 [Penicillium macrosclerotiorum]
MARYAQYDIYQQSSSTLDVNPAEEDEMSVLDDKILDSTSPSLSDPRRTSYDSQDAAYSHRNSVWSNYSHTGSDQSRPSSHLGHAILDAAAPQFMSVDGPQPYPQTTAATGASWALSRTASGSCTPTAYDQYPSEVETSAAAPFAGGAVGPVGSIPMGAVSYRGGGMNFAAPPGGVAMSPQSSQGWMPAPMDLADAAAQAKTAYRNGSPLTLRRDGIRKKNARFEIPAERTLSNIDHLISQSSNDEEIKELKQQKRLLRNRQAALDSRQRKKLHTEKLEEEKKHFTHVIGQLEEEKKHFTHVIGQLEEMVASLQKEKNEWIAQQQQITQYLEGMHLEKDEMIRMHTLETAELRKKNNILLETVEKLERGIKPTMADNQASEFPGFDNMGMNTHPWDEFGMANDMPMHDSVSGTHAAVVHSQSQAPMTQVAERAPEKSIQATSDSPFSWNTFYMCLLFGAFIASNSNAIPGRSLPQLSEEYRAESANVLKAVLASSPPDLAHSANTVAGASGLAGLDMGARLGSVPAPPRPSTLDELHDTLVMPTEDQERAQMFSLNAEQYNSLTTFEDDSAAFKPQQPSNLQQALAAMRSTAHHRLHQATGSDVYSRSLMWERVPEKVIRDFRRMVQEYGAHPVKEEIGAFAVA